MSNKKFNARHGVSVGTTPVDVIDDTGAVLTNAATATKLLNSRTISISGDVVATGSFDGSGNLDLAATIQANSVALGTDTTGNYLVDVSAGTGVSVSHTQSEGSTATISIGQAVGTSDNVTFNNLTLASELRGPATFVIDPAAVGDNTGKVVIKGDLQVDGTTTTINSTSTTIDDVVLTLGGDTAPTSDDTFDKGIEYRWYDTQARMGFFGFDRSTGKLTFIPQSTLSSGVYSGTTGEIDAKLDWSNVLNKPTIDNTTYNHLAVTTTGGALIRLNSSGGGNDDIKLASGTNVTVAYTNDDTITISSSYTDTNTTYSIKASTQTGGAGLDLDAGGSGSGTDTVNFLGSGGTTVTRTDADNITISSTSVGAGALTVATKSAGLTNTDVTLELSGAYNANTSTDRTIKAVVGPALTALATLMATAGPGFIRRTAVADTFSVDTSTYLTGNQTITLTGDVTGSGTTSITTTLANTAVTAGSGYNTFTVDSKGRVTAASTTAYLTSYSETSTLGDVTGRGASTSTAITLSGGTTTLGHATANTITTSTASSTFTISTKDNSSGSTGLLTIKGGAGIGSNISGGSVSIAGGAGGNAGTTGGGGYVNAIGGAGYGTGTGGSFVGRSGAGGATGASGTAYFESGSGGSTSGDSGAVYLRSGSTTSGNSGNVNISAGTANIGIGGNVNITGGDTNSATRGGDVTVAGGPASTSTSGTAGQLILRGGISNSITTSAIGGTVYLSGGSVSSTGAIIKTGGSVYIDGGGSGATGTITYGSIYIGNQANGTTYGTTNIYIGKGTGTNVYIKPTTVSAGFLKIDANGLVSSDTNTYLTSYTESDTLATVTGRGASTSTESVFTGNLRARKSQTNGDYTTAALWTESFNTTTTGIAFHISGTVGKFLEMRTNGTLYWNSDTVYTSGNLTNLNQLTNGPGYITGESDTLATVTGRGATTSTVTSFTGGGGDGLPALRITQTAGASAFNWLGSFLNSGINGAAGRNAILLVGQAESSKNSAYFGFNWAANSSNSNFLTLGMFGADNLVNVFANGNVMIGTTTDSGNKLTVAGAASINAQGTINTTTPGTTTGYGLHFGGQATNDYATGITFSAGSATQTNANAGIYVQGSGAYGTKMYIATTDSYATGSKTAIAIGSDGVANFIRARPQWNGSGLALLSEAGTTTNSVTFTSSGGAAAGTTFNGSVARTIDYSTVGAAASGHNHTYDVNNAWLRDYADDANVKLYGNSRQMAFRTDGTTEYAAGVGGYPFAWMYGGDAASQRLMLLNTSGDLWTSTNGWLSTALAGKQNTGSYLTSESDTLATVTGRGATTSSTVSFTGASKLGIQGANDGSSNYGIFLWQTTDTNWGIYMSTAGAGKSLASGNAPASLDGRTSHHVRFRAGTGTQNGFIWENAQSEMTVMSLTTDTGNLFVKGSLSAASKSFLIPHPTKEGWKLRYGSLEGPENGVYIRGKLKGKNKIELPEYWTKLVDPDSITVTLTPIGKHQKLYVEDISNNVVTVANDGLFAGEINCFFVVYGERVDVDKLVVEYE